ncbi:plasmid recombination protein, partial [Deltaproteobacteria bacterium OttesenSCG-928-K17]|nr:plasmid recombination protein [Deltaproteobacteria bacterium OttesenSCG-928-K17]
MSIDSVDRADRGKYMSSFLVLHMDKFGREAVRGIQSHNQRERKSRSNPDIESEKSKLNYDLHNDGRVNFQKTINDRIDSLHLKRAPRHDAVHMCGIIVSSNLEFFQNLEAAEQKRFFQSAKNWLEDFVGPENVIAANVHMDEKTPHLHFCHVPITPDG